MPPSPSQSYAMSNIDSKARAYTPSDRSARGNNVVDHDAPNGETPVRPAPLPPPPLVLTMSGAHSVTDEPRGTASMPPKKPNGEQFIKVQPLKRSEMQVRYPRTGDYFFRHLISWRHPPALVCSGPWDTRGMCFPIFESSARLSVPVLGHPWCLWIPVAGPRVVPWFIGCRSLLPVPQPLP